MFLCYGKELNLCLPNCECQSFSTGFAHLLCKVLFLEAIPFLSCYLCILLVIFKNILFLCVCVYAYICSHTRVCCHVCHNAHVEVKKTTYRSLSFLPLYRSWGLNLGHQMWQQVPVDTEPSLQPHKILQVV